MPCLIFPIEFQWGATHPPRQLFLLPARPFRSSTPQRRTCVMFRLLKRGIADLHLIVRPPRVRGRFDKSGPWRPRALYFLLPFFRPFPSPGDCKRSSSFEHARHVWFMITFHPRSTRTSLTCYRFSRGGLTPKSLWFGSRALFFPTLLCLAPSFHGFGVSFFKVCCLTSASGLPILRDFFFRFVLLFAKHRTSLRLGGVGVFCLLRTGYPPFSFILHDL